MGMTVEKLITYLERMACDYHQQALESVERNSHMNDLTEKDLRQLKKNQPQAQRLIDAVLIDFINVIAINQGGDWSLRVEHLKSLMKTGKVV